MSASAKPKFVAMTLQMLDDVMLIENKSYPVAWKQQLFIDCMNKNYCCQVMMINDQIAGYYIVQIILDEYHILNLCITPELQGKGLGRYQLHSIMQTAENEYINRILLEVRASNKIAKKLYQSSGFQIIGKRKKYYANTEGREDAHVMELAMG